MNLRKIARQKNKKKTFFFLLQFLAADCDFSKFLAEIFQFLARYYPSDCRFLIEYL